MKLKQKFNQFKNTFGNQWDKDDPKKYYKYTKPTHKPVKTNNNLIDYITIALKKSRFNSPQ